MPRRARIVIPGELHHVMQYSYSREPIFFDDEDRSFFLNRLQHYCNEAEVQIASYCLMTDYTYLLLIPIHPKGLSKALKPLHMAYSQYLNTKLGKSGTNWQGRFFSAVLDDIHSRIAFQFVASNPVKAKLVKRLDDYLWSSASAHLHQKFDPVLTAPQESLDIAHQAVKDIHTLGWGDEHERKFDELRRNTLMNLPYASKDYIEELQNIYSRNLTFRRRGRPRKF